MLSWEDPVEGFFKRLPAESHHVPIRITIPVRQLRIARLTDYLRQQLLDTFVPSCLCRRIARSRDASHP